MARESVALELDPARAFELWTTVARWPTFVEGFARVLQQTDDWPAPGSRVVWESIPGGRGRVTEQVVEAEPGLGGGSEPGARLSTQLYEDALSGTQTVAFEPGRATLELDYQLTAGGALRALTDAVFIRRALTASLARTLRRFAVEAAEEASL